MRIHIVAARAEESDLSGPATRVLGKVHAILDAFDVDRPVLTMAEIRAATGLPASTCARLVRDLLAQHWLDRSGEGFRVGVTMLRWGAAAEAGLDLVALLTPVLERLRDETGESAAAYVRSGLTRVCVAVAPTRHPVIWQLHVGLTTPLYVGSGGRALLAFEPEVLRQVLERTRLAPTERTLVRAEDLEAAVARTRQTGVAESFGELADGVAGVSAPVFDASGAVRAAVGLAGPAQRLTPAAVRRYTPAVRAAAQEATAALAGRLPPALAGRPDRATARPDRATARPEPAAPGAGGAPRGTRAIEARGDRRPGGRCVVSA